MPAAITDNFTQATNGTRPSPTTLTAIRAVGATTISCAALTGWPTATAVHFIIYTTDTSGKKVAGSQLDCKGVVSGTTITSIQYKAGTDAGNSIGAVVEAAPTAAYANDLVTAFTAQHGQDGAHGAVTATSLSVSGTSAFTGAVTLPNNTVAAANLATSAITLGYTAPVSTFSTSSTTQVQVTGLTVTVTIPAGGRKVKITVYSPQVGSTGTNLTQTLTLWDGTVGSGTSLVSAINASSSVLGYRPNTLMAIVTPSAGSKTYNVGMNTTSGTCDIVTPFILVEAI
jgi:hypothetical protein